MDTTNLEGSVGRHGSQELEGRIWRDAPDFSPLHELLLWEQPLSVLGQSKPKGAGQGLWSDLVSLWACEPHFSYL